MAIDSEAVQQVQIGQINLTLGPDGQSAICSFNLLGAMFINLVIPDPVVKGFLHQLREHKERERTALQVAKEIRHGRGH